jgi:hypothetical protein
MVSDSDEIERDKMLTLTEEFDAERALKFAEGLDELSTVWEDVQVSRKRDAIYQYLSAVFRFVRSWSLHGQITTAVSRRLRAAGVAATEDLEFFSAVIGLTTDFEDVDIKTRSKWSRVLRYAVRFKGTGSFKRFVQTRGGINGCAALYAKRLGRGR